MRKNLTAQFIETASTTKPREVFWDAKTPGFGLRVTANGARSWIVMYERNRRARMLTLGSYPTMPLAEARERGREALLAAQRGADPAAEKQTERSADTWATLCERFITEYARKSCKPRTVREYERIISHVLLPKWRNLKAKDVTRAEVKALIGDIRARGAEVQANRVLAMISTIANFGVREDILQFNPAARIGMTKEKSRDRVLSADEIRTAWAAFGAPARLLLLTGQRRGEVAGMRWSEIGGEVWTIPAERAKNGLAHRVPLVGEAARILRGLSREVDRVFPNRCAFERVAGIDFRVHDLRRTVGTGLAQLGIDRTTIKKVLNHSERGDVTAIYDRHGYDNEKRDALTRWDRRIERILSGERAKVVEFPHSA
jgi:integrase